MDEALDRFSQFLMAPTFNKAATAREIKTIHHQFKVALTNDFWHHTNLYMQLSDPESAIQKFIFGNKEGLKKPEAYKAIQDFYNEYYSADIMSLCVSSNKKCDEIEKMVKKCFNSMQNKKVPLPDYSDLEAYPIPYTPKNSCQVIRVVPIQEVNEIKIVWSLPYFGDETEKLHLKYF